MSEFTTAAIAAVEGVWPQGRVYAPGKVPAKPITPYVVMWGDGGRDDVPMLDGSNAGDAHRLSPMVVGKTADEVERGVAAVRRGLRGARLSVDGYDTTPIAIESSGNITADPDGGGLLTLTLFPTFYAYQTEDA